MFIVAYRKVVTSEIGRMCVCVNAYIHTFTVNEATFQYHGYMNIYLHKHVRVRNVRGMYQFFSGCQTNYIQLLTFSVILTIMLSLQIIAIDYNRFCDIYIPNTTMQHV